MFSSGYSSRSSMQNRSSPPAGGSSSPSSSRFPQTPLGASGYSRSSTYLGDTTRPESELAHLLSPPSPPPSLDQILSEPSNNSAQRPSSTSNSNTRYQNIYHHIEQELFAEPSSSSSQSDAGAITPDLSGRYQNLYDDFAQLISTAPGNPNSGSRQQLATEESTFRTSPASYARYQGVQFDKSKNKWRIRWHDHAKGRSVCLGTYATQSEAIEKLEAYKASRREALAPLTSPHPGVYLIFPGKYEAKYGSQGKQVRVGTFSSSEEAERALRAHRVARGLPPEINARKKKENWYA